MCIRDRPRAGRIQQNAVQRALQVGPEVQRITHGDEQVVQPQPPAYAFQQQRTLFMQLPGINAPCQLHPLTQVGGFPARRGARVQHLHAGADLQRLRRQHAALTLDGEPPGAVVRVGGQVSRAIDQPRMRRNAAFGAPALLLKQFPEFIVGQAREIGPHCEQ